MPAREPYPPKHHMLADLRIAILRGPGDDVRVAMPAAEELGNRAGDVGAAVIGVAVDVLGGNLALRAVQPDWCVTSTLELHVLRPLTRDFVVTGAPLRAGRTNVVLDVEVGDGDDAVGPAAVASMTFTRIPRRAETMPYREPEEERFGFGDEHSGLKVPFFEQIGCRVRDAAAGVVEIDVGDYVRNSVGALQGGAVVALVDAAAEAVASSRMVADAVTQDLQVHYLALGRVGPIRTRTAWLAGDEREARLRVELVDAGQDDRLVSMATVRLAAPR